MLNSVARRLWADANGCGLSDIANNVPQEVAQWLHVNANPCNQFSCDAAARGGHLAVLQWLIDIGCPWSDVTCAEAAAGGHLEVLKWLIMNGCP